MSNAVRQSFHAASDPTGIANVAAVRANADSPSSEAETRPVPILIASSDGVRAFDLFQPETGDFTAAEELAPFDAEPAASAAVPIADGQVARPVAPALDTRGPVTTPLNLPLGGIAPTDSEVAAARALIVGWIAACGIAVFAFLSQGPTVTGRLDETPPPPPAVDAPPAAQAGDIRLDPAAAPKPSPPQGKKRTRAETTPPAPDKPQPGERR
jgi:hypothetical protein